MATIRLVTIANRRCISLAIAIGMAGHSLETLAHGTTPEGQQQTKEERRVSLCDQFRSFDWSFDHERWVENDDHLNYRDGRTGLTLLHLLSWCDADVELIAIALSHGRRATARDADGQTPLHLAAEGNSHAGVITALVESGADIDAKDDAGNTPLLHGAHFNSTPAVIDSLVESGADLEARDAEGDTPLIVAARRNSPQIVQALLAAGADVHADRRPAPPPQRGRVRFIETRPVPAGITALHAAAESNQDAAVVGVLVAAGANVEAETGLPIGTHITGRRNPIMCPGSPRGASILAPPIGPSRGRGMGSGGERPIHLAARSNSNPAVIEALLEAGAEMRAQACSGATALGLIDAYNGAVRDSSVYWILREASYRN